MIQFKDIELEDKEPITSFILNDPRQNCDLSFSGLYSWHSLRNMKPAVMDGFSLLKFWAEGELVYMMSIGNGDLNKVLDTLTEDVNREGKSFCLLGIYAGIRTELETFMLGRLQLTTDRDYADYTYLHSDLTTLSSKKLQAKWNHVNKFRKTYDYKHTPIAAGRIQECLGSEVGWCKANNCDQHEGADNERHALICTLHNFDALGLTGGILRVEDKIIAFTLSMSINQNMSGAHIEKAGTNIDGAYAMINYGSTNHIPEQYIYISREEDLGIEGLRKAKLSYRPTITLEKYMIYLKERPIGAFK